MQTSVADSTSGVADPTFNNSLHNADIHLTKEREHSELQTIDFLFFRTRSKMVKESVHNLEACAFFSYIHG